MVMKKFIDKFFYLEDEEDYDASEGVASHVEKKADKQRPTKQPQAVQPVQPIHAQQFAAQQQQQQQQASTRFKRGRTQQQPVNEVDKMTNNVVSLQAATSSKNAKVVLVEPRVYAEAQDIAENIKNKRATIVNLQRIEHDQGVRIIDFLSGTVYALGGDIQRVGTNIFLCTPENVEVSGEISDYIDI